MYRKFARSILWSVLLLVGMMSVQAAPQTSTNNVERYTDIGSGKAKLEQGTLFSDGNGFVSLASNEFSLDVLGLTQDVLTAISGKTVMPLNVWIQLSTGLDLSNFKRSEETYAINNVPYILISLKGSAPPVDVGDGVLQLNSSGTVYCAGSKPRKFSAKNDVDLWLHVESGDTAVLYRDAGLSEEAAVLNLETTAIASNKASFVAFSGDAEKSIMMLGVFNLDGAGVIKSVKATMMQKGVLDACYSQASVSGKTAP